MIRKSYIAAFCLLLSAFCFLPALRAQQAQAQSGQPLVDLNAKYVQGVGPGYWPTAGSGLTLNVAAGTCYTGTSFATYAGGTVTVTASATTYVYLNLATCSPATSASVVYPGIATVVANGSAVTGVTDDRTWFFPAGSGSMVYPGSGVAVSSGSSWSGSLAVGTAANDLVQLNSSGALPAVSAANLTNIPAQSFSWLTGTISPDQIAASPVSNDCAQYNGSAMSWFACQSTISTYSAPTDEFITGFTSPNTFTSAQPSFANLSGTIAAAQIAASPVSGDCPQYNGTTMAWFACGSGGSMVYPGAGVPNSTGSAWGASYAVGTAANDIVQLNGSGALPAVSGANLTNLPSSSVSLSAPSFFSVSGSPGSSLGLNYATGVTSNENEVLAVDGSGNAGLMALTNAMIPPPGGDLAGTYANALVGGLHFGSTGIGLGTAPTSGQCLGYNGTFILGVACGSGSGTPGGSNGQVQGNNSGAFGGVPGSAINFTSGEIDLDAQTDNPALTLTQYSGASPASDIFDVYSYVGGVKTKCLSVNASGDMATCGNSLNLGAVNQATASNVYLPGGTPGQAYVEFSSAALNPPVAPTAAPASGGSLPASTAYDVEVTYCNGSGETTASAVTVTAATDATCTTSGNCEITVTSPAAETNATAYKVYAKPTTGSNYYLQNSSSGTTLGTNFTMSSWIGSNPAPPTGNTSGGLYNTYLTQSAEGNGVLCQQSTVPGSDCASNTNLLTGSSLVAGSNVTITPGSNNTYTIASTGGGGGSSAWSALTDPSGNLTLTMGSDTSTWNFNNAWGSGESTAFQIDGSGDAVFEATSSATSNHDFYNSPYNDFDSNVWTGGASVQDDWYFDNQCAVNNFGGFSECDLEFRHSPGTQDQLGALRINLGYTSPGLIVDQSTAATASANANSPGILIGGSVWNGSASVEDYWTLQDLVGSGTNGQSVLDISQDGSSSTTPSVKLHGTVESVSPSGSTGINFYGSQPAGDSADFAQFWRNGTEYWRVDNAGSIHLASAAHVDTATANNDVSGTITVTTSETSAGASFAAHYSSAPACTLTPTSNPGSVTWWVTTTTASVTANVSADPSANLTFNYICVGNPN